MKYTQYNVSYVLQAVVVIISYRHLLGELNQPIFKDQKIILQIITWQNLFGHNWSHQKLQVTPPCHFLIKSMDFKDTNKYRWF